MDSIEAAARDRLVNDPQFAPGLSPERRSELLADADLLTDAMQEEATSVLTMSWHGGSPGTGGSSDLREWHGLYFVSSSDFEDDGPFWSLDEALEQEWFSFPTPDVELFSSVVPIDRLMQIGLGLVEDGDYNPIDAPRMMMFSTAAFSPLRAIEFRVREARKLLCPFSSALSCS